MNFLEKYKEDPFFLYFSFGDPHWPTVVPEPYYSMYDPQDVIMKHADFDWKNHPFKHYVQSQAVGYADYSNDEKRRIIATYYGQISFTDKAIGMFLEKLEALGLDENTIVVFMSDHGDWGGNYGIVAKTGGFQETLIRVPAILRFPDIKTPRRIDAQISTIDVFPTVFDYLEYDYPQAVQGKSFLEVLKGDKNDHRDVIFCEVGDDRTPPLPLPRTEFDEVRERREKEEGMFWFVDYTVKGRSVMIRRDEWKYVYNTGFMNELYDIKNDPYELNNLIDKRKYQEKQKELEGELIEWLLREPVVGI
jgi:arylsulfatase A-like enzyme